MKQFIGTMGFLMVVLAALGVHGAEQQSVLIEINPEAGVNAREYLLSDIARIKAPGMMKEALENFSMGFSPSIGAVKQASGQRLVSKIRSISWLPASAEIRFPDTVFIKRVAQEISQESLSALFYEYVKERAGNHGFEVREFKARGVGLYPMGEIDLSVRPRRNRDIKGRVRLTVDVSVDGVSHGRVSMVGYVDLYDKVVCATRNLSRGEILESKDLCLKRINVSQVPGNYLTRLDAAVGMRLKQGLALNDFFRENMVEDPPLINRGDNIVLVVKNGNLRIVATGVADQEGRLGDQIQVNNLTTNRVVSGRISGPKTVDVFF